MPELPEVETVVRDLRALGLAGRRVVRAEVHWGRTVSGQSPREFVHALRGLRIAHIRRRAKFIVVTFSGGLTLLVHLRMTGQFRLATPGEPRDAHEHVILGFDDGRELRFRDPRKFGRWVLTRDPGRVLGKLGPEPLGPQFRPGAFGQALRGRARLLKPLLLDQAFIAGLGNIYVDEALWGAQLHPCRRADTLTPAECAALFRAIRRVLQRAIRNRGTTLGVARSNFRGLQGHGRHQLKLNVFHRTGRPCPRCGAAVVRLIVGQRSTHVCPACQPREAHARR
jgi:formamidopyrimidine-DNA glycosylase